jgi:SAM-dependent methyltransferase
MTEEALSRQRIQDFARRLFGHYTSGMLSLMVDIGHKTGLFEVLVQTPGTSEEIAARGGLDERYVREWLGAVVTGGIVQYDAASRTYSLPPEHAACLTGSSSRNLAAGSQVLAMVASRLPAVTACFRTGGGVPYSAYRPDFTAYQDVSWRLLYDGLLIKGFLPAVRGLPELLQAGIRVADIGCGTGHAIILMARAYPASSFEGYDISEEAIDRATQEARRMGLTNARFQVLDAAALAAEPTFDLITSFDAIHDQKDPAGALACIAAALAPGGTYLMVEPRASSNLEDNIGNPFAPYIYAISLLHCMTVSLAEGGTGLGAAWGHQTARRMLEAAGFTSIEIMEAPGPQNTIYICRR